MSREHLTDIIRRALTDADYRQQLLSNLEAALEEYDLSDSEREIISNLNADSFDELTMNLEERQSKSGFLGGVSLMGGKDAVDSSSVLDLLSKKYGGK